MPFDGGFNRRATGCFASARLRVWTCGIPGREQRWKGLFCLLGPDPPVPELPHPHAPAALGWGVKKFAGCLSSKAKISEKDFFFRIKIV
jgi:hypothetical protein